MPRYEVVLFNEKVRACVRRGERHEGYDDSWGDTHYIEVLAPTEDMARAKIQKQYPPNRGFVIEQISQVMPDGEF